MEETHLLIKQWADALTHNQEDFLEAVSFIKTNDLLSQTYYKTRVENSTNLRASQWCQTTYHAATDILRKTYSHYNNLVALIADLPPLPLYDTQTYTLLPQKIEEEVGESLVKCPTKKNLAQLEILPFSQRSIQEPWLGQLYRLVEARTLIDTVVGKNRKKFLTSSDPFLPHIPTQEWVYKITTQYKPFNGLFKTRTEQDTPALPSETDFMGVLKNIVKTRMSLQTFCKHWDEKEGYNPNNNDTYLYRSMLRERVINTDIWLTSDIVLRQLGIDYNHETNQYEEKTY